MIDVGSGINHWYSHYSLQGTQGSSGSGQRARGLHGSTESVGGCNSGSGQIRRTHQKEEKLPVQIVAASQWQEYPSTGYGSVRSKANSSEAAQRVTPTDSVHNWQTRLGRVYSDGSSNQEGSTRSFVC